MVADILRMRYLPKTSKYGGSCSSPLVLYIFTCMEFLGYLLVKDGLEKGAGSTKQKIWTYMAMTFGENFSKFKKHEAYFVDNFRNGLAHRLFITGGAISRGGPEVITQKHGQIVLDTDKFANIFVKSRIKFRRLFRSKRNLQKYPHLTDQAYTRLISIQRKR